MRKTPLFNYETLIHATAGATGSIVAMSCIYPLDNIKVRMQMDDEELKDKSTFQALIHILKKEGLEALYRGIKPGLVTLGISNFVYFYAFHGFKSIIPKSIETSAQTDLVLSIAAGVINVVLTAPLWVVNNRLKLPEERFYSGLLDGLVHIASTEGWQALWSGIGPSLILVTNPAIHFTLYEALKRNIDIKSAKAFFILGALSKTVATILTYPLQLAQTKQRVNKDFNISTAGLLLSILKRNGLGALYQGLETKMLQTVLSAAIMFSTYEKVAQLVFKLLLRKPKRRN